MSQALNMALTEEMARDERVFLIGEDIKDSTYGITKGLWDTFGPKRVIGTPISEAAIAGAVLGAASVGLRPVAEFMYMTFMMCAMDQVVNQAAKSKYMFGGKAVLPIVYRTMAGAGRANAAQHTQSLEAWFAHVPGLKIVMPTTAYDAKFALSPDRKKYIAVANDQPTKLAAPGLPFSLVFRAEPGKEDITLKIASAYEAASKRRVAPPAFGAVTKS